MANTKSAKKATRKIAHRTEINKARRSRMRSSLCVVEDAISSGDKTAARAALVAAEPPGDQRPILRVPLLARRLGIRHVQRRRLTHTVTHTSDVADCAMLRTTVVLQNGRPGAS